MTTYERKAKGKSAVANEDGVVLAIVVVILFIVLLVAGVVTSLAVSATDQVQHDRGAKAAQEAAEAGLNLATFRLTQIQPDTNACPVMAGSVIQGPGVGGAIDPTASWCPEVTVSSFGAGLGEGQVAKYRVSVNGPTNNSRTVVSVGQAPGRAGGVVSARISATMAPPGPSSISKLALAASRNVDLGNDSVVRENPNLCGAPPYAQGTVPTATEPSGLNSFNPASFCGPLVAVGGRLHVGASAHLCGYTFMNPGKVYRNNVVGPLQGIGQLYEGCTPTTSAAGTTADQTNVNGKRVLVHGSSETSVAAVPDITLPKDVATTGNDNCRLTELFTHPTAPAQSGDCGFPAGKLQWNLPAAGPDNRTSWSPERKALIIKGGNRLTLPPGKYFFCYLEVGGSNSPELHFSTYPGAPPSYVYIGDPTDPDQCGELPPLTTAEPFVSSQGGRVLNDDGTNTNLADASWGSIVLHNAGTIVNDAPSTVTTPADPRKVQIMMIGSKEDTANTTDEFVNGGTPGFMSLMLTAPHSSVSFMGGGGTAQVAALRADQVMFGGNSNAVAWDDRIALVAGGWQKFVQSGWYQCAATSNGELPAPDPTANC